MIAIVVVSLMVMLSISDSEGYKYSYHASFRTRLADRYAKALRRRAECRDAREPRRQQTGKHLQGVRGRAWECAAKRQEDGQCVMG